MIFTSTEHMGDFVLLWPIASWYYKNKQEKIHFVITKNYHLCEKIVPLLEYQPFTEKVSLVDVSVGEHIFNPKKFDINGNYINFAHFRPADGHLGKWMPYYHADPNNLGVDLDYKIIYPEMDVPKYDVVWIETTPHRVLYNSLSKMVPTGSYELNHNDPIIKNINLAMKANEVWSTCAGFGVLMELVGKSQTFVIGEKDPGIHNIRSNVYPDHPIQHKWIFVPMDICLRSII